MNFKLLMSHNLADNTEVETLNTDSPYTALGMAVNAFQAAIFGTEDAPPNVGDIITIQIEVTS